MHRMGSGNEANRKVARAKPGLHELPPDAIATLVLVARDESPDPAIPDRCHVSTARPWALAAARDEVVRVVLTRRLASLDHLARRAFGMDYLHTHWAVDRRQALRSLEPLGFFRALAREVEEVRRNG